jgi:hypothetical protein
LTLDPDGKIRKIRIREKHPGSATLERRDEILRTLREERSNAAV